MCTFPDLNFATWLWRNPIPPPLSSQSLYFQEEREVICSLHTSPKSKMHVVYPYAFCMLLWQAA